MYFKTNYDFMFCFSAVLKPGVVQVYENDGKTSKYFVSSGTISVNEDSSVQVLAEEAHEVANIDVAEARQLLSQYQSALSSASTDEVCFDNTILNVVFNLCIYLFLG